jgi:NADH-quinone oxidoreductase subunit L
VLSVIGGYVGIPKVLSFGKDINYVEHFLAPVFVQEHIVSDAFMGGKAAAETHHGAGIELAAMVLAIAVALLGIYFAWDMYRKRPELAGTLSEKLRSLYQLVANKYWVDELYDAVIVRPYYWLCRRSNDFDTWVVDGTVNLTGMLTEISGNVVKLFQTGYVRNYALYFFLGVVVIILYFMMS